MSGCDLFAVPITTKLSLWLPVALAQDLKVVLPFITFLPGADFSRPDPLQCLLEMCCPTPPPTFTYKRAEWFHFLIFQVFTHVPNNTRSLLLSITTNDT